MLWLRFSSAETQRPIHNGRRPRGFFGNICYVRPIGDSSASAGDNFATSVYHGLYEVPRM